MGNAAPLSTVELAACVQALLEASAGVSYLLDPETLGIVAANAAACRELGYSRAQLLTLDLPTLTFAPERALRARIETLFAAGPAGLAVTTLARTGEGREVTLKEQLTALHLGGRRLVLSQSRLAATDAPARFAAAQLDAQQFLADLWECAIIALDPAGNILAWNEGARHITGYAQSEAVGAHFSLLFSPADVQQGEPARQLARAAQLGEFEGVEQRLNKNGVAYWASSRVGAVRDGAGETVGFFNVLLDVSEHMWSSTALRTSELKFAKAFNASADLISISRLGDGAIIEVNIGFEKLTGYSRAEAVNRSHDQLGLWQQEEQLEAFARATCTRGGALHLETTLRRKDGGQRTLLLWFEFVEFGAAKSVLTIGRDITEWKSLQRANVVLQNELRESQKMEALGTLAGGIAHDFNNALAIISTNLALAREELPGAHGALAHLDGISIAAERARNLVLQILSFARRERLHRVPVDLAPLADDACRFLRSMLPAGITLRVSCVPDCPQILADRTQVEQALVNLCTNAWQAPAVEGRPRQIHVQVAPLRLTSPDALLGLSAGSYVGLSVRDNGPGMPEATLRRVFEPFFTTKPTGEGTGLGLSVVYSIVVAHDAKIDVQSTPGAGSVFTIYFPAAAEEALPAAANRGMPVAPTGQSPRPGQGERLLYIDDEESLTRLVKRLLELQGYVVSVFAEPRAAVAAVTADPASYDLVITDFNMPGLSGLQLTQALRAIRPDLPVIIISGYISEELRGAAPAAGVCDLVYKPDTVKELGASIARVLARRGMEPAGTPPAPSP